MAYKRYVCLLVTACIIRSCESGVIHTEMAVPLDANGDGVMDGVRVDFKTDNGHIVFDMIGVDSDGDGVINGFDIDGDGQPDYQITPEQARNFETLVSTLIIENDLKGIPSPRAEGDYYNDMHVHVVNVSSHDHSLIGELQRGSSAAYIRKHGFSLQTIPTLGAIGATLMLFFIVVVNVILCWCIYKRYKMRSVESNLSITVEHQSAASDSTEIELSSDMDEVTPQPSTPDPESVSAFRYPSRQRQRSLTVCRKDQLQ